MTERNTDKLLDQIDEVLGEHDARVMHEILQRPDDGWSIRSLRSLGTTALYPRFSDAHLSLDSIDPEQS